MKIKVSQLRKIIREEIVRSHSSRVNKGFFDTVKQKLGIGGEKHVQFDPKTAGKPGTDLPKRKDPSKEELEKSRQETAEKNKQMDATAETIKSHLGDELGKKARISVDVDRKIVSVGGLGSDAMDARSKLLPLFDKDWAVEGAKIPFADYKLNVTTH